MALQIQITAPLQQALSIRLRLPLRRPRVGVRSRGREHKSRRQARWLRWPDRYRVARANVSRIRRNEARVYGPLAKLL
jgi:hypothetical protein